MMTDPSPPTKSPRNAEPRWRRLPAARRRQEILTAAKRVADAEGVDRMTIERVCRVAGISNPTFFRYFPNRQALLSALAASGNLASGPTTPDGRDAILHAAEQLFGEHGYEGTSVASIAAAAGVSKAAIYWHFRSKEALLDAAFQASATTPALQAALAELRTVRTWSLGEAEPADVLRRIGDAYVGAIRALIQQYRMVLSSGDQAARLHSFLNRFVVRELLTPLALYLDREVSRGTWAHPDPCLVAQAFYGMLLSFTLGRDVFQREDLRRVSDGQAIAIAVNLTLGGLDRATRGRPNEDQPADPLTAP